MTRHVEVVRDGHVLEVTLNKPKVNAIDHAMSRELAEAFRMLREDPQLRVAILTAAGERIFSAGWDLKALDAGEAKLDEWWADGDYGEGGFAGLTENWKLNKPVVVAVNGLAIGGGFEMALAGDLIIAAEHVEFALPEMPLGMVPDAGAIQRLPRRVPYNIAVISLDGAPGCNAIGNVVNRGANEVEIGQRVRAIFEEATDPQSGEKVLIPNWEAV